MFYRTLKIARPLTDYELYDVVFDDKNKELFWLIVHTKDSINKLGTYIYLKPKDRAAFATLS